MLRIGLGIGQDEDDAQQGGIHCGFDQNLRQTIFRHNFTFDNGTYFDATHKETAATFGVEGGAWGDNRIARDKFEEERVNGVQEGFFILFCTEGELLREAGCCPRFCVEPENTSPVTW